MDEPAHYKIDSDQLFIAFNHDEDFFRKYLEDEPKTKIEKKQSENQNT